MKQKIKKNSLLSKNSTIEYRLIFLSFNKTQLERVAFILKKTIIRRFQHYFRNQFDYVHNLNIPQKTHKFCLTKSPFVHKKSQEVFEIRTYKSIFIFKINFKHTKIMKRFLLALLKNLPSGIDLQIKIGI